MCGWVGWLTTRWGGAEEGRSKHARDGGGVIWIFRLVLDILVAHRWGVKPVDHTPSERGTARLCREMRPNRQTPTMNQLVLVSLIGKRITSFFAKGMGGAGLGLTRTGCRRVVVYLQPLF